MLALDGFAVLRAIGAHPDAFSEIDAVVAKTARDLIAKRLKLKSLTAQDARTVRHALGEPFDLIVDEMNAANLKSLVAKLDKHNPDLKRSNPELHRRHLRALLNGTVEPAEKTKTTSKTANKPGRLDLERPIGAATGEALSARGHRVEWLPELSIGTAGVCAISGDLGRGILYGGADPRRAARAMGW